MLSLMFSSKNISHKEYIMNFNSSFKNLWAEVSDFSQYKQFTTIFKAIAFFAILPFALIAGLLDVFFYVCDFFYRLSSSSISYLEDWVNKTREGVSSASEAVIFLVTTPIIFLARCFISFVAAFFFIIWFFLQCFLYIATLGGIKWRPYIYETDYSNDEKYVANTNFNAACVTVLGLALLFGITIIIGIVYLLVERKAQDDVYTVFSIFMWVYLVIASLSVPLVFRKSPASEIAAAEEERTITEADYE